MFFPKHVSRNTTIGPRCPVEGGLFILTRTAMECFPRTNWQYKLGQRSSATILWWGHHLIAYPPEVAWWNRKRKINGKQCGKKCNNNKTVRLGDGWIQFLVPSGFLTVCHGKSPFLRTVSHLFLWAISHGYVSHNQRVKLRVVKIIVPLSPLAPGRFVSEKNSRNWPLHV
jgi:hypothetical protein